MTKSVLKEKPIHKDKKRKIKRFRCKFPMKTLISKTLPNNATQKNKSNRDNKFNEVKKNNKEELKINVELIRDNMTRYSDKLISIYFKAYSKNILKDFLMKESKEKENKKVINEEILNKYKLTKVHRKYALKYLLEFIKYHKINIKCYFSTVLIFDLFLINYAENDDIECQNLLISKKTNQLSETKLILLILCCFYLTLKFNGTKPITVEQLLEYKNAKEEMNEEDLIQLIDDIAVYTDLKIDEINLYNYIEVYMIDILQRMKEFTNNQQFLEIFQNYSINFSIKIMQTIELLNIPESLQALAIVIVSFEYGKHLTGENNEYLDSYLFQWIGNLKNMIMDYKENDFQKVICFLNYYISKER
jgi:hypothetical protein